MIVVVGSGLAAVTAAHSLLDRGFAVMLTTAHAEFGFPHGGCGFWDTSALDWPLSSLEEAVGAQERSTITCRSQWLVKRLVHRFTKAGGQTSTRVRLFRDDEVLLASGTGAFSLHEVTSVLLADQDVPEPSPSAGTPLISLTSPRAWYGAVVARGTPVQLSHAGKRGDGSIEIWTTSPTDLEPLQPFMMESMHTFWEEADEDLDATHVVRRTHEAVDAFLASDRLDGA